jgi:alkylhydroperoxidase family enzyme
VHDDLSRPIHDDLVERILNGDGQAPPDWRRAAFDGSGPAEEAVRTLVNKVASDPTHIADADFRTASRAGLTDDQIWVLIICAAVGQSARQYDGAIAALATVMEQES